MDSTGATADTGVDCPPHTGVPPVSLGAGCEGTSPPQPPACPRDGEVVPTEGTVVGANDCGCATPAVPGQPIGWALLLYVLLRRGLWMALWLVLPTLSSAQVDGQRRGIDGGDWLLLQEPEIGMPWTGSGTLSVSHARDPVRIVGGAIGGPRLQRVTTQQLDVSLLLEAYVRVGLALPRHTHITFMDQPEGTRWGDTSVWMMLPITDPEKTTGLTGTWSMRLDIATGAPELWLGDPGALQTTLALGLPVGRLRLASHLGLRSHTAAPLPGLTWGSAWQWGLGARVDPWGPLFVAAEAAGRAPVRFYQATPAEVAGEVIGVLGIRPTSMLSVSAGAGRGIAEGLGSSALRVLGAVDLRPRRLPDRDEDGLVDLRDLCPDRPEDPDDFRDGDGCPDLDNDRDGIVDAADDCPILPENFNGVEDFDGCPDLATMLTVVANTEGPAERVTVTVDGTSIQTFPGEPVERLVRQLEVEVVASAPRHRPVARMVQLGRQDAVSVTLSLEAQPYGWLEVVALSPEGVVVPAEVQLDGRHVEGEVEWPAGEVDVELSADGYLPVELVAGVPAATHLRLPVTLTPSGVRLRGDRLQLAQRATFALDEATVDADDPAMGGLLGWLRAHGEVELLRIEGHADGLGSSRYNYELSQRRAEAVRDWLIERGIDGSRLQAVGTGEALSEGEDLSEDRRVGFLVLVWTEETLGALR